MTDYNNNAVPRCNLCQAELHEGLNGRDHEPDCPSHPENQAEPDYPGDHW